jgi:hypothetical protein
MSNVTMFCDLHLHSTASDGTDAPDALPALAKQAGLSSIALTDHDTTAGLAACAHAAHHAGIQFIAGIELSADPRILFPRDDQPARLGTLHILGYFIRPDDEPLARIQQRLLQARTQRNPQMIQRLNDLGVSIDYDEVIAAAGGTIVGRPHIAQVLLRKGYVKSIHEAFSRYIGEGAAAYVRKDRLPADEAIHAIHNAGGLAVLAHPVQLRFAPQTLEHAVARLKSMGLDGIEVRHSDHHPADVEHFEKLARKLSLLTTGGSDYHGSRKQIALGACRVPITACEQLHSAWLKRN